MMYWKAYKCVEPEDRRRNPLVTKCDDKRNTWPFCRVVAQRRLNMKLEIVG